MKISPASLMNILTTPGASDAAREERVRSAAEARVKDAQAALETLKKRRSEADEARKAAAKRKIEQIKARLQMLQSMSSVDPKGTARLAAQLARELGAAVKAYASASGTSSGGAMGGAEAAPTAAPAAQGGDAAASAPGTPAAAQGADEAAGADGSESGEGKDGETRPAEGKSANPYQRAIDEASARNAERARESAEKQADQELMGEVRRLAAEIKALIRKAAEKTPDDRQADAPGARQEQDGAIAAMDGALATAGQDLSAGGVSLLV